MLQIREVSKRYKTGELVQQALDGVSLDLRDSEFVSVLGPSGSGKTTLLNVIGGLDRYDAGDLIINGVSTKEYKDRDWDAYRNHTVGFVFQSYNLIPHQSVLSNVELALTIGGVSRKERRARAKKALETVGLGNQLHKRPNQMSGGQMQRVAIARALVNDPEVLLADEPTGALDTETSVQVMELLKEVAKDRLVVMVTHNPELAQRYSTRIVKLRDGKIVDDSAPLSPEEAAAAPERQRKTGKAKMSFLTSLSLSFNNLRTKKGRTLLTAFAGSIGIIGIALILALSTGVNDYITSIQKETMTSYPLTISAETVDLTGMMEARDNMLGSLREERPDRTAVYADYRDIETSEAVMNSIKENNLAAFKRYLDDPGSDIRAYLGENGVSYSYKVDFFVYSRDPAGELVDSDADTGELDRSSSSLPESPMDSMRRMSELMGAGSASGAANFTQLMEGQGGEAVSPILTDSYDLLYGGWPQAYDEAVLVLDRNNSLSTGVLYQLGFITADEYREISDSIEAGEDPEELSWSYEELCDHTFYVKPACDRYVEDDRGVFSLMEDDPDEDRLLENTIELKLTGVIRPKEDAANAGLTANVAYTAALTETIIDYTDESAVVKAQEADPDINVLTGMAFEVKDDEGKAQDAKDYLSGLGVSDKAAFYTMVLYYNSEKQAGEGETAETAPAQTAPGETDLPGAGPSAAGSMGAMPMEGSPQAAAGAAGGNMPAGAAPSDETALAAALDQWLENDPDQEFLLSVYDQYLDGSSYEDNLKAFGKTSYATPSAISIYTDSFEDKEAVSDCIDRYNDGVDEESRITYTDYVALLTSSITQIVNVISYVLIAFVAVSLIVSCIMIGIITHISVLERTKEIGILRALGASKRNISQVFNAETIIIGLCAGALGVGVSALLTIPINSLIQSLLDDASLAATLHPAAALILVAISVVITVIGGLIPAKNAAKKDPVAALRTE